MSNGYEYRFGSDQSILGLYMDLLSLRNEATKDYEAAKKNYICANDVELSAMFLAEMRNAEKGKNELGSLIEDVRSLRRKILAHLKWEDKGE